MSSKIIATLALATFVLGGCSSWDRHRNTSSSGDRGATSTMDPSQPSSGNAGPGYPPTGGSR